MWSFGTTMTMANDRESSSSPASTSAATVPQPDNVHRQLRTSDTQPGAISSILSQRSLRQLGIFFAGAGFLTMSTLITKRSIARVNRVTIPKFFIPSNKAVDKIVGYDNSLIALEAMYLGTLNVLGAGIMCTGGVMWAFDISSVDDLRKKARRTLGEGAGQTDEEAEREVEEYLAKIWFRKEQREKEQAGVPTAEQGK